MNLTPNHWTERLRALAVVITSVGVPTLMLGVFVAWTSGYLPSPLTAIAGDLKAHDQRVDRLIQERIATDKNLIETLNRMNEEVKRLNRVRLMKECAEIREELLRRRCIEEVLR
jgi:hypothetical protein